MKFYSFEAGKRLRLGLGHSGQIADLPLLHFLLSGNDEVAAAARTPTMPPEMLAFIRAGKPALGSALAIQSGLQKRRAIPAGEQVFYDLDSVRLLPPILRPGKIMLSNRVASGTESEMNFSAKLASTLIGTRSMIQAPGVLISELHVAGILGRKVKNVSVEDATIALFGCTLLNDLRLKRAIDTHSFMAANHDTFCPAGPAILTLDELDPETLQICYKSNHGTEERVEAGWLARIAQAIADLSLLITLEPGDIVSARVDSINPMELHPGETIRVESPFGILENQITPTAAL